MFNPIIEGSISLALSFSSVARQQAMFTIEVGRETEADPDIDETTLLDTLESATDLHEVIGEVVRSALEDEAMLKGLEGRLQ